MKKKITLTLALLALLAGTSSEAGWFSKRSNAKDHYDDAIKTLDKAEITVLSKKMLYNQFLSPLPGDILEQTALDNAQKTLNDAITALENAQNPHIDPKAAEAAQKLLNDNQSWDQRNPYPPERLTYMAATGQKNPDTIKAAQKKVDEAKAALTAAQTAYDTKKDEAQKAYDTAKEARDTAKEARDTAKKDYNKYRVFDKK